MERGRVLRVLETRKYRTACILFIPPFNTLLAPLSSRQIVPGRLVMIFCKACRKHLTVIMGFCSLRVDPNLPKKNWLAVENS